MRALLLVAFFVLPLVGCGGEAPSIASDAEGGAEEGDRFWVLSRDGKVKLGLTDESLYFRLSDRMLEEVEAEMARDVDEESGLGGLIAGAVAKGVSRALRMRASFDVEDIRSIGWDDRDQRLRVDLESGTADLEGFDVGGEPVLSKFTRRDVERLREALAAVRSER